MNMLKKLIAIASFATLGLGIASASNWGTDAEAASAQAKQENKLVLMNFTGSDWCHWCHKIEGEIFSTAEFKAYAEKNLVLLMLDFPDKKPQSAEVKEQNRKLQKKYGVRGFPTIIVLNSSGEQVGKLGYTRGGPSAFIKELESIKANL